ncbi:GGDEF domain-containing protein [Massilia niabensis]|uniref:diguanylate cyclase n=1 Tax=Massilia niabensis TaxID=544910 RepID=A0ABW0L0L7_9BURK
MERLTKFLQHSYLSLLARVTPPEVDPNSEEADDIARLLNLALLAVPVLAGFVAEFAFFGIWQLALSLALAGVVMVASPWIYWKSASLAVARESFLISLFVFKLFESMFLASVSSPGSMWFIAMPTIAILLGSVLSGVCWLGITTASLLVLYHLYGGTVSMFGNVQQNMDFMYTFSMIFLSVGIVCFVAMVDASRKKAFRRLQDANAVIRQLAIRDPLTGIFNRRYIWERMQEEEQGAQGNAGTFHICLIDLDRFKQINDTMGHAAGDLVLQAVAKSIQSEVREEDCFGRYGGEEFILILKSCDSFNPGAFAERIRQRVAALSLGELGAKIQVTVSMGIAQFRHGESFSETINRADSALYTAKASGRNRVVSAEAAPLPLSA